MATALIAKAVEKEEVIAQLVGTINPTKSHAMPKAMEPGHNLRKKMMKK